MKNISATQLGFTFTGCFLGAGYVSGQELYQFFGAFGPSGIIGLFTAVAILALLNVMLIKIVGKTKNASIDAAIVGANNKPLLSLAGFAEIVIFFGTYVVMAAGAGSLVAKLANAPVLSITGSLVFSIIISFISVRGITGLVKIFSAAVPVLVVMTVIIGAISVYLNAQNGLVFTPSDKFNPLIPNWFLGAVTFASYNLFCSIGVLCPVGLRVKSRKTAVLGTVYGCIMLIFVAFSVMFSMAASPMSANEALPMLAISEAISPYLMYIYAALLFIAMSGASLACLIPIVAYAAEKSRFFEKHAAPLTFAVSFIAFILSCFGFADLVGTVFSSFGYIALFAVFGLIRHYRLIKRQQKTDT